MNLLIEAIQLAIQAHAGQTDKNGQPYILHCLRVMLAVQSEGQKAMIVAVLHDVVEDTGYRLSRIDERFGMDVAIALAALSHQPNQDYTAYIERVARANPIAKLVKIADIEDNLRPERLWALPADERARLEAKYSGALRVFGLVPEG